MIEDIGGEDINNLKYYVILYLYFFNEKNKIIIK